MFNNPCFSSLFSKRDIWDFGTRMGKTFDNRHFKKKVSSLFAPDFFFKLQAVKFIFVYLCCGIMGIFFLTHQTTLIFFKCPKNCDY